MPGKNAYRFIGQLKWWEKGDDWQVVNRDDGTAWVPTALPFVVESTWRGVVPNDNTDDDRGWILVFHIPFSSLGLPSAPVSGTQCGMALSLHDRDDAAGTPILAKHWPELMEPNRPVTWGQLSFGVPDYSPPPVSPSETITIRNKLNGKAVFDAHVGGHTTCGQDFGPSFFDGWGDANYACYEQVNIQNQSDVADWPCVSKYYVTFPLDSIPINKAIFSAKLRIYQFGNSGQGHEPPPMPSLIQVLTVSQDWDEETITWNNAPLANENVSQAWVDPVSVFPGWPGVPREWDVSRAVSEAYLAGTALRLVLYSADAAQHSGKFFISSETGDWNSAGRPALEIIWGEP